MKLNPDIVSTVNWLNENGFVTTDSGDGETCDFACDPGVPYVHMLVTPDKLISEVDRLVELLAERGITLEPMDESGKSPTVDGWYIPTAKMATISLWNVKF